MKTQLLPVPGLVLGPRPERQADRRDWLEKTFGALGGRLPSSARPYRRFAEQVAALDAGLAACTLVDLRRRLHAVRARMSRDGPSQELLAQAFCLVGRAASLTLGKKPFATQFMAARIMLDGRLAEMATGEGKTLAAGLCAAVAALAGTPVHVVTANDYLAARDAELMQPLFEGLELQAGVVTASLDAARRHAAYACDITYCTARELAFDYLRDSMRPEEKRLMRGLCMAIVDEADSVLIDEACVPLVISRRRGNDTQAVYHRRALDLAAELAAGSDYRIDSGAMAIRLTGQGRSSLEARTAGLESAWRNRMHREETVETALAALYLYERDRHYVVREGAVCIVDETTGRTTAGRAWSRGLQQMIELKEGCKPSGEVETAARITYQGFFGRYLRLGGMSGTLRESRAELQSVYGLRIVEVPLRAANRRHERPPRLFADTETRWRAVVVETRRISAAGRPVLIGTDSVADSEALSRHFMAAGIAHQLLNARQDRDEAQVVAGAGAVGRVTIATNMAGRGTDIVLAKGVAARGGLHVICCQHAVSRRIDRQFAGRCARQGDPGSVQSLLAADQPLLAGSTSFRLLRPFAAWRHPLSRALLVAAIRLPQVFEENHRRTQRRELLRQDRRADELLPFVPKES